MAHQKASHDTNAMLLSLQYISTSAAISTEVILLKKKILKLSIITIAVILIFGIIFSVLVWNGVIILNESAAKKYPVTGVDVSSYQGEIDWEILSSQNISFAFIKATEGSSFVDEHFAYNYAEARKNRSCSGSISLLQL